jgi:predicted ester cyclase
MSTGKSLEGRREVERFLDLLYVEAFRARDEIHTVIVEGEHAVVEALFVAEHIGTFDGIAATKREARVSYCGVYQVVEGTIKSGHIYLPFDALREQLTTAQ